MSRARTSTQTLSRILRRTEYTRAGNGKNESRACQGAGFRFRDFGVLENRAAITRPC